MMRVVPTHDPEVLRLDDDSIAARMLGVILIVAGVSIWPIYLNADSKPGDDLRMALALVMVGSLVCVSFGLAIMLYSGQTIVDRRLGKVVHWQRFLWWRPTFEHDLDAFDRVAIVRSNGRPVSWGVQLISASEVKTPTLLFALGLTRSDASALADRVAAFAGLRVDDRPPASI